MPPRRKQAAEEDASLTPHDGASGVSSEAKPKKKRTARAKRPAVSPSEPSERIPAIIPIKTAPPIQRISIEPDIHAAEPEEAWRPSIGADTGFYKHPTLSSQSRQVSKQEVEDLLRSDEEDDRLDRFRPPVRTGAFRKIALGFAVLALFVGAGVTYAVYAHATVLIYPQKAEVKTERVLTVSVKPESEDGIPGEVAEVTVAGEKTGVPSSSTKTDGVASGFVTLVNTTGNVQTLVATTRLLAPDGTLFRLKAGVNVPSNGRIKTEAYADKPGASGDIAPTRFTIPGLNAALQKTIYAESEAPMTGGIVAVGTVTARDIEKTENALREELVAQARLELEKAGAKPWTGHALSSETMSRSVSASAGEKAGGVTVRLSLRVRTIDFDRAKAVDAAAADLQRSLTSDRELLGIDPENPVSFTIDKADPKNGTASLRVALNGQSIVSLQSPLFDAAKLRGLGLEDVRTYFEGIEGVERVDVKFRPFWLKRMPLLPGRIEFQIEK